jgi:uncharacterized membrane protein YhiD involved in acid resistance
MLLQSRDSLAFPLINLKGYPMKKILIASAILCFASAPAAGATGAAVGGTVAGLSTSALIAIGAAVAVVAGAASSDSTTTHHGTTTHH